MRWPFWVAVAGLVAAAVGVIESIVLCWYGNAAIFLVLVALGGLTLRSDLREYRDR